MKGNIFGVVVVACALVVGVAALNAGFDNAAQADDAVENTTVDFDQNYTLAEEPDPFEFTNLTVTSNGSELRDGTDFVFDAENGTIDWRNTALTTDGDNATVAYAYRDHSETTQTQAGILRTIAGPVGFVLLMTVLGALLVTIFRDPY